MAVAMGVARTVLLRRSMSSPVRIVESLKSPTSLSSPARSSPPFAACARRQLSPGISRIPAELGGAQSLMPFHSATASALLTSMLSVKPGGWGWLSEGFPLPNCPTAYRGRYEVEGVTLPVFSP